MCCGRCTPATPSAWCPSSATEPICFGGAARLQELRVTAAQIETIGDYYKLRARSTLATYVGVLCGLAGSAAIIAAFAWPVN